MPWPLLLQMGLFQMTEAFKWPGNGFPSKIAFLATSDIADS